MEETQTEAASHAHTHFTCMCQPLSKQNYDSWILGPLGGLDLDPDCPVPQTYFLLRPGRGDLKVQLLHQVLPLAEYHQLLQLPFDFGYTWSHNSLTF